MPKQKNIQQDEFRKEDIKEAYRLYDIIENAYKKFGVKIIKLRKNTTIKLADEIIVSLDQLQQYEKTN